MPNYKGHLAGGALIYAGLVWCITLSPVTYFALIEWLLCCLAGSLFPDIDTKSKGQKIFYRFIALSLLVLLITQRLAIFIVLSLLACVPLLVRHRGLCHRVWFIVALPSLGALFLAWGFPAYKHIVFYDALFFMAGALSHIGLDKGASLRW